MSPIHKRLLLLGTTFSLLAAASTALYTFTGWFWWVPAGQANDRANLILAYHALGAVVGVLTIAIWFWLGIFQQEPEAALPIVKWDGIVVDENATRAQTLTVALPDETFILVTEVRDWHKMRRGMRVFGYSQGTVHTYGGQLPEGALSIAKTG